MDQFVNSGIVYDGQSSVLLVNWDTKAVHAFAVGSRQYERQLLSDQQLADNCNCLAVDSRPGQQKLYVDQHRGVVKMFSLIYRPT